MSSLKTISGFAPADVEKRRERQRAERTTRDQEVPLQGGDKTARIDVGLALLSIAREPGASFTRYDIAAWAGCTNAMIYLIEKRALKKLANSVQFGRSRGLREEVA